MGSGLVGALAYTFSDTFWFSAVEGEVYAFSSLFTAVVFWLILKWEDVANEPHSDRWLILIAYLTGSEYRRALAEPALPARHRTGILLQESTATPTPKVPCWHCSLRGILVAAVLYGIVPGIVKVGGWFELLFVNTLGMSVQHGCHRIYHPAWQPASSGVSTKATPNATSARMALSFILTIAMLGIPFYGHGSQLGSLSVSLSLPHCGSTSSEDAGSRQREMPRIGTHAEHLAAVHHDDRDRIFLVCTDRHPLHRQHADGPELSGRHLHTGRIPGTRAVWHTPAVLRPCLLLASGTGRERRLLRYRASSTTARSSSARRKLRPTKRIRTSKSPDALSTNTPRTCCSRVCTAVHTHNNTMPGRTSRATTCPTTNAAEMVMVNMPTQWENIKFFFSYQLNFMYWRYFMWNFAGRQNDIQGSGEIEHGNWITGIPFIDNCAGGRPEHSCLRN